MQGKENFLISYSVFVTEDNGNINEISNKEMRVKNQLNELGAKIALEGYLRKKYGNSFHHLVVTNCKIDFLGAFKDMFGSGSSNPFNF